VNTLAQLPEADDAQKTAWYDVLGKWQAAEADFERANEWLTNLDPSTLPPELQTQRQTLLSRASLINNTIANITGGLSAVKSWLTEPGALTTIFTTAESAGESIGAWFRKTLGFEGFSALPLIPIAVVAAALATISYFLSDYLKYRQQVELVQQYIGMGYTPEQAAAAARGAVTTPTMFEGVNKTVLYVALAGAAFLILPHLLKRFNK
jgi:hypothetical protein